MITDPSGRATLDENHAWDIITGMTAEFFYLGVVNSSILIPTLAGFCVSRHIYIYIYIYIYGYTSGLFRVSLKECLPHILHPMIPTLNPRNVQILDLYLYQILVRTTVPRNMVPDSRQPRGQRLKQSVQQSGWMGSGVWDVFHLSSGMGGISLAIKGGLEFGSIHGGQRYKSSCSIIYMSHDMTAHTGIVI